MVRGFGLLLVVGIAVAFVCALTAGSAAWSWPTVTAAPSAPSMRGAGEILRDVPGAPRPAARRRRGRRRPTPRRRSLRVARRESLAHPGRVLAVGAVLAVAGWVADTQTSVQSDVTKLVPPNMPALRDLRTLERVTGVSGEIDIVVHAKNVATPATVGWMISYENALFTHYGYLETKGCAYSTLCPALSLPDLFSTAAARGRARAR